MALYRFTFTDCSTLDVHAPDAAEAKLHLAILQRGGQPSWPDVTGKALATPEPVEIDKLAMREAINTQARG